MSGLNKRSNQPTGDQKKETFMQRIGSVGDRLQNRRDNYHSRWDEAIKLGKKK